jgi:hypothetical protein
MTVSVETVRRFAMSIREHEDEVVDADDPHGGAREALRDV